MLQLTIAVGLQTHTVRPAHLHQVSVDTTVQPKVVAFPMETRLYLKGLRTLVRQAKRAGLPLRQSYLRLVKAALVQHGRYAKAKQFKRARRIQRRLKGVSGRVYRDVQRKLAATPKLTPGFREFFGRLERFLP